VDEAAECLESLAVDPDVKAAILTGHGPFFSFGFDIPEFLGHSKESFASFLKKFTRLYTYLFTFPKPVVAALNGHAVAGGCMLALACDYRIMVSGKAKISLNEIGFGSSVFAGSVAMLQFLVGGKKAQAALYEGTMYSAEPALQMGMIDQVCSQERLLQDAHEAATRMAGKDAAAFRSIKNLLRSPLAEEMVKREAASVQEFVDIWYSEKTWKNLQAIKIHS
jgi:enoyl-CoA hydratase/carnithine racemase